MGWILDILENDALMWVCLMLGCLLTGSQLEKKRLFLIRWGTVAALLCFWAVVYNEWLDRAGITGESPFYEPAAMCFYLVVYLLFIAGMKICYIASFYTALFCVTVSYCLQNFSERVMEMVRLYYGDIPTWADRMMLGVLMLMVLYGYGKLFVWDDRFGLYDSYDRLGRRALILTAFTVTGLNIILDTLIRGEVVRTGSGRLEMLACLISAAFSLLALVLSMSQMHVAETERQKDTAEQLLVAERHRYEQEKATREAINVKCHDIRHQIAALGDVGYRKELKDIGELIDVYDCSISTDNAALDVVLSGKSMACSAGNITLTCVADGRRLDFMVESDIYSLFGNILDNAMDAVQQITEEDRRLITLTVRAERDFLIIEEENYYLGEIVFEQGLPQTSREDRMHHGYGMRSIRLLTDKYGGDLNIQAEDGIYTLSILFPLQPQVS